jgi:hypothetical protein
MGNKINKKIDAYDKLQVKHSVHIASSNIKQTPRKQGQNIHM